MNITKLSDYIEILTYDTAFWMAGLNDADFPIERLGELSLEVSSKLRAIAILSLLVTGDPDIFYHNLIRSGLARNKFLQRLVVANRIHDHHSGSGRYQPLLDAVAARDFDLASQIARLSPLDWQAGHEYEADYCYAQVLHRLIQPVPPEQEILPYLSRFEAYLDGDQSARLDLCKALAKLDQAAFDEAFDALICEQDILIAGNKERGQLEDPIVIANRLVFVEGLTILRLAEKQGLQTQQEYRFCPSLARGPMTKPFPGE